MSRSMPSFASVASVLVLFFICVVSSSSLSSHTSINNVGPGYHPCEMSDDLTLTNNDKVKRGPFGSVKQMERVHMLEALLNKVTHSLRKGGVCFWAERDTLLAAHRHGATFPYAEHLDLAIMARSVDSAIKSLSLMNVENGEVDIEYEEASGRITVKHIKLGVVATVRINIYSVSSTERRLATPSFSFQPLVATVFPLKKAMFNGEIIPVPANSERYLMGQFGYNFDKSDKHFDWKTMSYVQNTKKGEEDVYPLVSIIIPTYGRPAFLKKSIEFIKRQDYPNLEVVIVDDSPEANSQVIEGEDQQVFRYYHLSSRKSIGVKRNIAVEKSNGAIIVHWDDDDYFREHRVTQQVAPIIKGEVQMTVLEHHLYFHLPSKSFYHVRRASTWGPHFATFVFSRTIWDAGLRYPDNSMAEDYAFAEASLKAGFKIDVLNNEDGKHVYVRHRNTWEFELEDYASQVQKVDRPAFFSLKDESFFLSIETKSSAPKPPRHFAAETIQWDRPELQPGWKTGIEQQGEGGVPPYYPHYPPYYPKYPNYNDEDDVFDATWIFVGIAGALPIVLAVGLGGYFYYKRKQAHDYTLLGEDGSLNSVA